MARPDDCRNEMQRFLYAVSHDLQEPFRKVRTFGQRLAQKLEGRLDDAARGDLEKVLNAAERGQGMIEGLLVLSRLETHSGEFVDVDLNETLAAVCEDLGEKIRSSDAVVSVETLPTIQADADQMSRLFFCLVDNGIKFAREGVEPSVRVYVVDADENSKSVRIAVEDNGIGLEEPYADRVFTVFQRLHPRDVYPGLGLGLAYSQKIVNRHGGAIEYEQIPDGGTRFLLTLSKAGGQEEPTRPTLS